MKIPKIVIDDQWLSPYKEIINNRSQQAIIKAEQLLSNNYSSLTEFAKGYNFYGVFFTDNSVTIREWAPNATRVCLLCDHNFWQPSSDFDFKPIGQGNWELITDKRNFSHGNLYKLMIFWPGGSGERIPAWCTRVVQDPQTNIFSAQVWCPQNKYEWQNHQPVTNVTPLIYEAHIGMAGENEKVASFAEFETNVLPRVKKLGYNTIQLMAIQEHPYYGSFGYHVSSFFAASSRFGTPHELKHLIDTAHGLGIKVIMDIVHSHAVKNEVEGLGKYDGTRHQFFHQGPKGEHPAWDSYCFNYGNNKVLHFLLSNIQYWLTEYRFDGFRFDGVTSMLYLDHGLGRDFTSYQYYFDNGQDEEAITYLILANELIHQINPYAITIAEEMSGYPGLAAPVNDGGLGFDYRLAMGIPDFWIKILKEKKDEEWPLGQIYHELTAKRADEKTISYCESHDQALVGDKTIAFRLMDKEMYFNMMVTQQNLVIDRGIALHKMIRLITAATAGGGYLNFMGNEFGHPEWIDFPRHGNNWSYKYATRQWSLVDREDLKYQFLNNFDSTMIKILSDKQLPDIFPFHVQHISQTDLVLAFTRSNLLFVFNFNPVKSFTNYGVSIDEGKFKYLFSTDETQYGGFGRVDEFQIFHAKYVTPESKKQHILMYLPARTAIVLERVPLPKVHQKIIDRFKRKK